jgi:hypothetical protein
MTNEEMKVYFKSTPPKCIAKLNPKQIERTGTNLDGHGEDLNTFFQLVCDCESDTGQISGYSWNNPDFNNENVFISPYSFICTKCQRNELVFDSDIHGYDGEFTGYPCTARGEGEKKNFSCKCGCQEFKVTVRFEYPDDLFDDEDFEGRQQDAFTWFNILGECKNCSAQITIADIECA